MLHSIYNKIILVHGNIQSILLQKALLRSMASMACVDVPKKADQTTQPITNLPKVIKYVEGDLFTCAKTMSMSHCVSEDLKMGKGIAVLFKKRFQRVDELKSQNAKTGQVAILEDGDRFIYYLVTKRRYFDKPTYKTLQSSLAAMRHHCLSNDVKEISMPQIGSGLDKLDWKRVQDLIANIFADTGIMITVYIYKKPSK